MDAFGDAILEFQIGDCSTPFTSDSGLPLSIIALSVIINKDTSANTVLENFRDPTPHSLQVSFFDDLILNASFILLLFPITTIIDESADTIIIKSKFGDLTSSIPYTIDNINYFIEATRCSRNYIRFIKYSRI